MDFPTPQRQLTREEINRCFLRWQHLRNEHGQNAQNIPEFIYYSNVLRVAAKQQQQQQQQQQLQQQQQQLQLQQQQQQYDLNAGIAASPTSSIAGTNTPNNNFINNQATSNFNSNFSSGVQNSLHQQTNSFINNKSGTSSAANSSVQQNSPNNNISNNNVLPQQRMMTNSNSPTSNLSNISTPKSNTPLNNGTGLNNGNSVGINSTTGSIFSPSQTTLLKAQIAAMKCMLAKQAVPKDVQNIISSSLTKAPNYNEILVKLGRSLQVKKQQLQQQHQSTQQSNTNNTPAFVPSNNNLSTSTYTNNNNMQVPGPRAPTQEELDLQRKKKQELEILEKKRQQRLEEERRKKEEELKRREEELKRKREEEEVSRKKQEEEERKKKEQAEEEKKRKKQEEEEERKRKIRREMPQPINKFKESNPTIQKIINVNNPNLKVESYTLPESYPGQVLVPYKDLFNNKAKIIPSLLPPGIDVHSALEVYQTLVALNVDTEINNILLEVLKCDTSNADYELAEKKLICEYNALQLLPLQKAMRGHILQFEWFQRTLVSNTHPNFLSKVRKVNIADVSLTDDLFTRHEVLQLERIRQKQSAQLEAITDSCALQHKQKQDRRNRRMKFGHKISSLHNSIEKEEQKRIERNAKRRLQALKANDEEAYIKLLDQTKDTRITQLLKQTNSFLDSLTKAVKNQQEHTRSKIEQHLEEEEEDETNINSKKELLHLDRQGDTQLTNNGVSDGNDDDDDDIDYYSVAHKIKEEVKQQPSILVGGTLKDYQLKGLQWMVSLFNNHLNGILADEMGLGKTIQTISLLTYLYETKRIHGPFLVIVPLSTLTNWNAEFDRWAPVLRKIAYKGTPNERKSLQKQIKSGEFDVVLTTFEYIIREKNLLSKIKWVHMIIDEGHRMKNAQSKLSLTLNTYYHTDYRLILTGTPLQNNLPELWALLNFVLPKIFNSVKSFDEWFNTPFDNTGSQDRLELSEEETLLVIRRLHKVLRPFLLRRLKKDVEKELPQKVEKVLKCRMSALQQKLYEQMLKYRKLFVTEEQDEKKQKKKMVGSRGFNNQIMQLKKICNHPFVFDEVEDTINPSRETNDEIWRVAGKFELLQRVLPKFKATGHRVLLFFQMTQIMNIMEDFLRLMGLKYLRLDGQTKADDRTILLNLFNEPNSEYFCFLLSTRAGGLGLNLQTADTVIIFDTDWNPHQDLQAQDRAHRIGQKNEVRILRLITQNSVEEAILERAYKKLDIDGKVIQAGKFDNKSTAEEQEAILRSLLDAEEERKRKSALGIDEDDEFDDSELNTILARSDKEIEVFQKLDDERAKTDIEHGITTRLMGESELPEVYHKDIEAEMQKEEMEEIEAAGRGNRERKKTNYAEDITEDQWLKQFEVSDNDDDGSGGGGGALASAGNDNKVYGQTEAGSPEVADGGITKGEETLDHVAIKKEKEGTIEIKENNVATVSEKFDAKVNDHLFASGETQVSAEHDVVVDDDGDEDSDDDDDDDFQLGPKRKGPKRKRMQARKKVKFSSKVEDKIDKRRSEEHTSELQSLTTISYAVFCLKKKKAHV
ncbi:related to Transcription regulatory protein SNF2 [Saccharomycodes ludwigii]|uniref:Related to Transcription regulatory protein SNF2 n=1 Tax=Saccharomycodes ludwigii TaxID=36035 RepID=A0A376BAB0_9ASCO|nr:related to Transcription regulatory protein SNF2 [Saccharomycodes ludwigii]